VLKHYLLDFNWYRAITQCTRTVGGLNVLTTKLGIKIVREGILYAQERGTAKRLDGSRCHTVLDGDPVGTQPLTAAPNHIRSMSIVAKQLPISATAELLVCISAMCFRAQVS